MIKNVYVRILLLPVIIILFGIQLVIFTIMVLFFGVPTSFLMLLFILLYRDSCDKKLLLYLSLGWIIGPFVWWYRYFKYGEFKILKEFEN